jgi:phosphoserine phosphatase
MTILILRRHAHIEEVSTPSVFGALKSRRPRFECARLRHWLNACPACPSRYRPVALYPSPMGRRLATAAPPISQALNIRSQTLSNLQDLDYGEWQGVTHEAARHKAPAHTTPTAHLEGLDPVNPRSFRVN